jgi:hypothetical protein
MHTYIHTYLLTLHYITGTHAHTRTHTHTHTHTHTYCHTLGFCVTHKTGFGLDDGICWNFIPLVTFYKSLSPAEHSRLLATLLLQINYQLLLASFYIASGRTPQKTSIAQQRMSFIVAYSLPRYVFTESLPSNEYMHHNTYIHTHTPINRGGLSGTLFRKTGESNVKRQTSREIAFSKGTSIKRSLFYSRLNTYVFENPRKYFCFHF